MQTVSENWKEAHRQTLLNESFVEVSLNIADPDALAGITSSQDNGAIYISDSSKLANGVDKTPTPYCTLEQNLWCLDGSRKAISESDFGDASYVSDVLSDDTCIFSAKIPTITIQFGKVFSKLIPGITITWSDIYGEFADTFKVIAYNGETIVAEKEVTGNRSVKTIIQTDIANYDRIVILIKKWCLPNHRARVEEIFVGLNRIYGKTDLFDYSHTQSVDPISTNLPKAEIKFSIDNSNGEYNPYNTDGMSKYLTERQEIKARYGLKMNDGSIEWVNGGTFYLSEWYAKQNSMSAEFTARDMFEFLSDIYHDTVTNITERSLAELATDILRTSAIPTNSDGSPKWVVDEVLASIYTTAPLPEDTRANCLQLIANAGGCVLYQDREGVLHLEPLKGSETDITNDTDYKIDSFNSYSKSEITLSKPIKEVRVKVYGYTMGDKGIESTNTEVVTEVSSTGEIITIDNPLITYQKESDNPNDPYRGSVIGQWIARHLGHRMTLDSSWRADVRLDALDIVRNVNDYKTNRVRMTEVDFKFNGAFRASGKGKVIGDG